MNEYDKVQILLKNFSKNFLRILLISWNFTKNFHKIYRNVSEHVLK